MQRFLRSFVYAWNGLVAALKMERNLRFHFCVGAHVYALSVFYGFSAVEYSIITLLIVGVISLELMNSALERVVNKPSPARYREAGLVKDMAAAAVLVFSVGAAFCGVLMFWKMDVFADIYTWFALQPWRLLFPLASIGASIWVIFIYGQKEGI